VTPLHRLVRRVVAVGLLAQATAFVVVGGGAAIAPLSTGGWLAWAHGWQLVLACVALTFAGDWVAVRVRHGEETEELTLFEAACVVDVLVLPAHWSLFVPVVATVLCSITRRRGLVKVLFNGANLAAAVATLVLCVHLFAVAGAGPTLRTILALMVGMLGLTGVNLVALSRVLAVLDSDNDPWRIVKEGLRLSVVMAVGTVALGGTAVTLAAAAPALLPFALMPAFALTFAFKAAAQESEERERSARLLRLSHVLAGRLDGEQMLESFLELTRQAFGADKAVVVLEQDESAPVTVLDNGGDNHERRIATLTEQDLLQRSSTLGARVLREDLPRGWRNGLSSPLELEGRQVGVVLLGSSTKHRHLAARELTLLTSLSSALSVSLRGAADLTRLVDERHKLKAVVDQSSDGILVLDGEGLVQLWSPALARLTGLEEATLLGEPLGRLVTTATPEGDVTDAFRAGRDLLTPDAPHATVELLLRRDDGEQRVISCAHAGVFEEGELVRDVVIVHDVTRERQVERMKADFIATVSHELRTPVTPIKGYADLLRRRGHSMTEEKRAECLEIISDRAAHLSRLVEDLLLASRISESGGRAKVDMGRDDLVTLLHRAAADFGEDNSRITVEAPESAVDVTCDSVRVIQVLSNLLGNALKYSVAGSPVTARLRLEDRYAVIEVEDAGRGIPADQVERVFDKFHRVEDPLVMTTGGTGLGLYIARQLTGSMGGELSCRSTLSVGSVFTLRLCLAGPGRPTPEIPTPRQGSHEGVAAS
jgi:PAS domain S-box-containing protein